MSAWPALVVGEGWLSEHYFGSDAGSGSFRAEVLKRRKLWDEEAAQERPTRAAGSPDSGNTSRPTWDC